MKSKIGPVTAYADAVQAGYTGTREEFARQQAEFAKNAAKVEQAKTEVNQTVVDFTHTAQTAKEDIVAEGDRQVQRIADATPNLELDREQIAINTAGVEEAKAAAEEAKVIAKGRATGYVFDTVEDMETWLSIEENTQNLVLGDNLYIRATDVPDYWWDGEQAQPLETQKVDMQEYVKFTDYASSGKAGVIKLNGSSSFSGIEKNSDGELLVYPAPLSNIKEKSTRKAPVNPSMFDLASVQSTHQEMSNDYDPSTAVTPDGNVPYAYGDRQPVSYAAVKKYIDDTYGETWKDVPVMELTLEEEVTSIYVEQINGESFEFEKLLIEEFSNGATNAASEMQICVAPKKIAASYLGFCVTSTIPAGENAYANVELKKISGLWNATGYSTSYKVWLSQKAIINHKALAGEHRELNSINTITSFSILPYSGTLSPGVSFKIYGKPARKGVTT